MSRSCRDRMDSFKWYQRYFLSRYKFFLFNVWKLPINQVGDLSIAIRSMIDGIPIRLHRGFDPAHANAAINRDAITLMSVVSTMLLRMLDENGSVPYPSRLLCALLSRGPIPQS